MKNPSVKTSSLVKIGEAAKALSVSIDTLRRWERAGKISSIRTPGGTRLYNIRSLSDRLEGVTTHLEGVQAHLQGVETKPISTKKLLERLENQDSSFDDGRWNIEDGILKIEDRHKDLPSTNYPQKSTLNLLSSIVTFSLMTTLTLASLVGLIFIKPQLLDSVKNITAGLFPDNEIQQTYQNISQNINKDLAGVVLAVSAAQNFLQINADTQIIGSLAVSNSINNLSLEATPSASTFELVSGNTKLTVSKSGKIDQDISTSSSPSFSTLKLSSAKSQLLFGAGNASALTWTPTSAKILTLPDVTGEVTALGQTISNSELENSKVTVTAGTNLSGGGEVALGSSITISLKDSPTISGVVLLSDGTASAPGLAFSNDTNTGLYRIGADKIGLITGGSGTQGITIDSSGLVGIGTISPSYKLDIAGTLNATGAVTFASTLAVNGGDITTTATTATLFNSTATTLSLGGGATTALNLGNGNTAYTAINIGSGTGGNTINIAGTGATGADTINIGTGGTAADTITIGNSASTTSLALTSGTGSQTFTSSVATGTAFSFVSNSVTTGNALTLSSTGTTTGEILDLTGTWAPTDGSTNEGIDINITHTPTTSADNFQSINLTTTDGTALANTVYNQQNTLTLTGNAAKTGIGLYSTVTTSSTTADTIYATDLATSATGIIASGTRSNYGLRTQPASTGASTAGTQNMYGVYSAPSSTLAAGSTENVYGGYFGGTATLASGTINRYGLYVANATMNTTGTSTQYGLYVESPTGADTNYAAIFAGGNVGIGTTTPTGGTLHVVGQCVTGDTLLKRRRRKKLADGSWIDEWEDVRIDRIKAGDEILTLDEKTGEFIPSKVKALLNKGIQDTYVLKTQLGKKIRTTIEHPYFIREAKTISGTFEADQSIRIEDLARTSFIALADKNNHKLTIRINPDFKKSLVNFYRKANRQNLLGPSLWARSILALINKMSITNSVVMLDEEYPNYQGLISQIIEGDRPDITIGFKNIGHKSPAHFAAYGGYIKKQPAEELTLEDIWPQKNDWSPEFTGSRGSVTPQDKSLTIRRPSSQFSKLYTKKFDLSRGKWRKVSGIKPGMEVLTVDGWERITALGKVGREQTYDIEVENTHNFVGNNIVAHNTYISSSTATGIALDIDANSLSSGSGLDISSTSTAAASNTQKGLNIALSGANGTASQTTYGGYISNTHTGTTSTNVGIYATASGGSNNYAAIFDAGSVGIGTTAPAGTLHIANNTSTSNTINIDEAFGSAFGVDLSLRKARGSISSPTVITSGDDLAAITGRGYDGSSYLNSSQIVFATEGTIATNAIPGVISFRTTANGTLGSSAERMRIDSSGNVSINDTTPDALFDIDAATTTTPASGLTDTGVHTGTGVNSVAFITANSATTGDIFSISATGMTTGEIADITATYAPTNGSTNEGIDINITHTPTTSADNFQSINLTTTDGTALGNTIYNQQNTLTLTGNAAKTGIGSYDTVTSSSTTADTLIAFDAATSATGIIASGTRSNYGLRTQPASTGASTAGTQNMYGVYSAPSSTLAAGSTENVYGGYFGGTATVASGTINRYGLYVANATMNTTGTSTQYGLYVESPTGADTNYAAIFAGGNVGIGTTTPTGGTLHVVGQCVAWDTRIRIRRRRKPSLRGEDDEAIYDYFEVMIKDILEGDEVLSLNEQTQEFEYQKVEKLLDMGVKGVYELTTLSGKKIRTTGNHPYLSRLTSKESEPFFEVVHQSPVQDAGWVKVMNLNVGNQIAVADLANLPFGGFSVYSKSNIDQNKNNENQSIGNSSQQIYFNEIHDILLLNKYPTNNDTIPQNISTVNTINLNEGSIPGNTGLMIANPTQNTEKLINQSAITESSVESILPTEHYSSIAGNSFQWDEIVSIKYLGYEHVYDLQIANTHNFVGNNIVAHNTYINSSTATGIALDIDANSLSSGSGLDISSTSTAAASNTQKGINVALSGANSTSTQTTYGGYYSNTHTGTTSTNVGLYATASGGTNNYAAIFESGNVGIGTTAPEIQLDARSSTGSVGLLLYTTATSQSSFITLQSDNNTSGRRAFNFNNLTDRLDLRLLNDTRSSVTSTLMTWNYDGSVGVNDTTPDALLDIDSSATTTNIFGIGSITLTTGEIADITATYAPTDGSTNEGIDINITHTPTTSADNFQSINLTTTDGTALGNTVYNQQNTLTLTGNAAKTGIGTYNTVTSSSTTADTLIAFDAVTSATGIIASGTRSNYGLRTQPASTGASTAGTQNMYGVYSAPSSTLAAGSTENVYGGYFGGTATVASGTINRYGLYVANATMNTTGTSTQYGLYVESPTGADTNYAAVFAGGNVGIGIASPLTTLHIAGADTTTTQITYRSSDANWHGRLLEIVNGGTIGNIISSGGAWSVTGSTFSATKDYDGTFPTSALYIGNQFNSTLTTSFRFLRKAAGSTTTDGTVTELVTIDNSGNVGIGDTTPDALLDIDSTATTTNVFGLTNTGAFTGTGTSSVIQITANSLTTGNLVSLSTTGATTGEVLDITGTWAPTDGSTNEGIDINITHTPTTSADNFTGIDLNIADGTALGNTVYGQQNSITLTGNAAKTGIGNYATVTSSSTTADTLVSSDLASSVTGIITTGTRSVYGLRTQPASTAASTGGTTNVYGVYSKPGGTVGVGGTINSYGLYVANGTMDTTGTSANYGIQLEPVSGADTNIGICFDCDGTYSATTVASGIQFGTDTTNTQILRLYRSSGAAAAQVTVDDGAGTVLIQSNTTTTSINLSAQVGGTAQRLCHDGADAATGVQQIGDCGGTQADLAEYYDVTDDSQEGDLVMLTGEAYEASVSGQLTSVAFAKKSQKSYQQEILGIISTNPSGEILGELAKPLMNNAKPIALAGRVPVKVSTDNGPILRGDYLTSSSTPGVAMKATHPGQVVGKALESFDQTNMTYESNGTYFGKVLTFVNVSYADPGNFFASLSMDDQGNLLVPKIKTDHLVLSTDIDLSRSDNRGLIAYQTVTDSANKPTYNIDVVSSLKNLETAVLGTQDKQASSSAALAQLKDTVASASAEIANLTNRSNKSNETNSLNLTPPDLLLATGSATLADLKVTSEATFSGKLAAYDLNVSNLFKVFGETTLAKTNVAGDLSVDGTTSITGSSINSLGTLFLQNSALATKIDLFNGQVIIDNKGKLIAQTISAKEYLAVAGASVGTGKILAGTKSVVITTPLIKANSRVLVTPTQETNQTLAVTNKTYLSDKSDLSNFTVSIPLPITSDINFDWFIVNESPI